MDIVVAFDKLVQSLQEINDIRMILVHQFKKQKQQTPLSML